jgi:K+-sensing histidine kinase KdpD
MRNEVEDDAVVFADGHRLEQMLTNLVDNAIKFNGSGSIAGEDVNSLAWSNSDAITAAQINSPATA